MSRYELNSPEFSRARFRTLASSATLSWMNRSLAGLLLGFHFCCVAPTATGQASPVERYAVFEVELRASGQYANPYVELDADATLTGPSGKARTLPLFWDGGVIWKLRFSPNEIGTWKWSVLSRDAGLNGQSGSFEASSSKRRGSIRPMKDFPLHFERQDGTRFWFLGDTAWALYLDSPEEKLDRQAALKYIDARAAQGFNVLHSSLLSEAGWGNRGGPPFHDIAAQRINPSYWQEVDLRLAHANARGLVCGLALAWGDKGRGEPYAWSRFADAEARRRYARYIAARYSAYDVYFLVAGEWHAEIRAQKSSEEAMRREFIVLGDALAAADPHGRMIAIHPMTSHGSVREFQSAKWMAFGDYQQNYVDLHGRVLESLKTNKPVVNSEYGYFLRDQSGDGVPDKDNSTSLAAMRHATWDIVMAGGYIVTGFGTTYFGGNRDPGPFNVDASKNDAWEAQLGHMRRVFLPIQWWKLAPHNELLACDTPRGKDGREFGRIVPPPATYWCLADPLRQYIVYVRGISTALRLSLDSKAPPLTAMLFNPRTGERKDLGRVAARDRYEFQPPDSEDWVVLLTAANQPAQRLMKFSEPWTSPFHVDPQNPHHLVNGEGRHLFILNKTAWAYFGCKDPASYLDRAKAEGITVIRAALEGRPYWETLGIEMWPWGGTRDEPDFTRLNHAYWDEVERRVRLAGEKGIGIDLCLYMTLRPADGDVEKHRLYWHAALNRLGKYANLVTWEIHNEYLRNEAFQDAAGAFFHENDPFRRPVCTSDGTTDDAAWPDKSWVGLAINHSCTSSSERHPLDAWYLSVARNTRSHGKPAWCNESGRERRHGNDDGVHRRKQAWLFNAAGCYWTHHSWDGCEGIDDAVYRAPGSEYLKPLADFWQSVPFWTLNPNHTALAVSMPGLISAALADSDRRLTIAYVCTPTSGAAVSAAEVAIRLPPGQYAVRYIRPADNKPVGRHELTSTGLNRPHTLTLPDFIDDLVIVVSRQKAGQRQPLPGTQ
jgi:hypothetical protein